jgi:hypothetical protein
MAKQQVNSAQIKNATVNFGGSGLSGATTTKTFTPASTGVLYVTASSRVNAGSAADNIISISATGTTNAVSVTGVGNGTADGFTRGTYVAQVTAVTSVTITISATYQANSGYMFFVMPGIPVLS